MAMEDTLHFTSTLEISTNKLWGAHLAVPPTIADTLIAEREDRRIVCVLNGKTEYQCAMLPRGDGTFLITVNKKIQKDLHLNIGSRVEVSLRPDDSKYGLPMPEELAEVLAQDPEGNRLFHALPPGKLRTLLYIVGKVKNSDARIGQALIIVEHLKANAGKINYRQLGEALKGG
ncbi:MAG: YdeI/OmpD-associated family protein [Saprospiraceae bacterium]